MFENVLVALDGSAEAEQALEIACGVAHRTGGKLVAVHALDYTRVEYTRGAVALDPLHDTTYERALRYLDAVAEHVGTCWHLDISPVLLESDVRGALLRAARGNEADLVVLASHGRNPRERFWLGSVADEMMRDADCPVMVVPISDPPVRPDGSQPFKHVLVPLDGSHAAEVVLGEAAELARLYGARLTLLHMTMPSVLAAITDDATLQESTFEVPNYLTTVTERLRPLCGTVHWSRLDNVNSSARSIVQFAAENGVDAIAMATHARHGLSRIALGSVTDEVVRHSSVPVLVRNCHLKESSVIL